MSSQTIKPMQGLQPVSAADRAWVTRRTFSRVLAAVLAQCGIEIQDRGARQTPSGIHFPRAADQEAVRAPFAVSLNADDSVRVAPGMVRVIGSVEAFVLQSDFLSVGGSGFVVIRARVTTPVWTVDDGFADVSDFGGWATMEETDQPRLDFVQQATAMTPTFSLAPVSVDPVEICFPIAHVDALARTVTQLCFHGVNIGFQRLALSLFWPDLQYDLV